MDINCHKNFLFVNKQICKYDITEICALMTSQWYQFLKYYFLLFHLICFIHGRFVVGKIGIKIGTFLLNYPAFVDENGQNSCFQDVGNRRKKICMFAWRLKCARASNPPHHFTKHSAVIASQTCRIQLCAPSRTQFNYLIADLLLLCLSAYSQLGVATAEICIFITWHLFYGRMSFLPPTLYSEGKLGHLSSTWRWGVPLSALPKDTTSELAGLFSTTSPKCRAPSREAVDTIFFSLLVWLDKGNEPQVYRLRSGRSNHYTIASVT